MQVSDDEDGLWMRRLIYLPLENGEMIVTLLDAKGVYYGLQTPKKLLKSLMIFEIVYVPLLSVVN